MQPPLNFGVQYFSIVDKWSNSQVSSGYLLEHMDIDFTDTLVLAILGVWMMFG